MNQLRICVISVVFVIAGACTNKKEYYVAPDGKDSNSGTIEFPFATIQKAVAEIKAAKYAGGESTYQVVIRKGKYVLKEPIVFKEKDSGTDENPVIFTAYEDEDVIISGGVYFKSQIFIAPCKAREVGIYWRIKQIMKHLTDTQQVINPARKGLTSHRKRVLRSQQRWWHEA